MTFTTDTWAATADVRAAIDDLPFLRELAAGTLEHDVFRHYLTQDALYLAQYGRVLAAAGSQSSDVDDLAFWASNAVQTVVVERELHASHVADLDGATPSPTCAAYTSFLLSLVAAGSYPVLVAGVLPCFWIYDDVGTRLKAGVADLAAHPFGDWIATYGDEDFAEQTTRARAIVDRAAASASDATRARMHAAFHRACQYEWMFWDAAYRRETWPVG